MNKTEELLDLVSQKTLFLNLTTIQVQTNKELISHTKTWNRKNLHTKEQIKKDSMMMEVKMARKKRKSMTMGRKILFNRAMLIHILDSTIQAVLKKDFKK